MKLAPGRSTFADVENNGCTMFSIPLATRIVIQRSTNSFSVVLGNARLTIKSKTSGNIKNEYIGLLLVQYLFKIERRKANSRKPLISPTFSPTSPVCIFVLKRRAIMRNMLMKKILEFKQFSQIGCQVNWEQVKITRSLPFWVSLTFFLPFAQSDISEVNTIRPVSFHNHDTRVMGMYRTECNHRSDRSDAEDNRTTSRWIRIRTISDETLWSRAQISHFFALAAPRLAKCAEFCAEDVSSRGIRGVV